MFQTESAREHQSRFDSLQRVRFSDRDEFQDVAKRIPRLRDSHRLCGSTDRRFEDVETHRLRSSVDGVEAEDQELV